MIALIASALLTACRAQIPAEVELSGRVILRNRRGIVQCEYPYQLKRRNGKTDLKVDPEALKVTDVTADDLELKYLWWDEIDEPDPRDGETVNGQVCTIINLKKDDRLVKIWVDKKTGALMQAEELKNGEPVRRLWGTRLKKFGERWMANVIEVETLGSGHRTKITVETLK